jgi:serine/threonine protein phosphatase PrpC
VAVLVIKQHEAAVIWVGDSRIYRFRDGTAEQLTRDHSHVQKLVDQKLITREEAESHPRANVITRAVGIEEPLKADILNFSVETGDRFLVCTDGLSRPLSIDEISTLMQAGQMDECVQSLLHEALARGARDNVTLITVECADS